MKKFRLITALTLALLLVLGTPLSAMAASWDVTDSQGVYDAFVNDTDAEVIINMQNDIDMEDMLTAGEGQSYIINGNGNTISDVVLSGEGSVDINADITNEDCFAGIQVMENADVTVNGDITSTDTGAYVSDDASLTVNGDVTAEGNVGVDAIGTTVTVNGDVSAEYGGVLASNGATVTVQGNVDSNSGSGIDVVGENTSVNVTGDVTGYGYGVSVSDGAEATVTGNVTGANGGVYANNGNVDITGDVTSSYDGVAANEGASVTVGGDVFSETGDGVFTGDGSNVEVSGDVTGGSSGVVVFEGSEVTVAGNVSGETGDGVHVNSGNADIAGDVTGLYSGVVAYAGASVTVGGDVTGENNIGIDVWDESTTVVASGNVSGDYGGIVAVDGASVTVTGDVSGNFGAGINTWGERVTVNVTGNVTGNNGILAEGASVTVTGDVTAVLNEAYGGAGYGIDATDDAVVTVDGNVKAADAVVADEALLQDPLYGEPGGIGVYAADESQVTVTGNVTGGNGAGTYGDGGSGVEAEDESVVTIGGNVTGGDVIADPEVLAHGEEIVIDEEGNTETVYWNVARGGKGIYASADATVTVGGDVNGGSTNADHGAGGIAIRLTDSNGIGIAGYEGTGKLEVKGTVSGGAAGPEGEGGAALYFGSFYGYLPAGEVDFEEVLNAPAAYLTEDQIQAIGFMINVLLTVEEVEQTLEEVLSQFSEHTTEEEKLELYYGAFQNLILSKNPDFEELEDKATPYGEITIGTLSDKNGPKLDSTLGQRSAEMFAKGIVNELVPTGDNPRTGDGFSGIVVVLMVVSLLGMVALLTQRKRFV